MSDIMEIDRLPEIRKELEDLRPILRELERPIRIAYHEDEEVSDKDCHALEAIIEQQLIDNGHQDIVDKWNRLNSEIEIAHAQWNQQKHYESLQVEDVARTQAAYNRHHLQRDEKMDERIARMRAGLPEDEQPQIESPESEPDIVPGTEEDIIRREKSGEDVGG